MKRVAGGGLGCSRRFDSEGAQTIARLRGCKRLDAVLSVDPLVALAGLPAPPTWDRAYIELISPLPGVMGAGRLLDDDEALPPGAADDVDGLDGGFSVWISASVQ
jgi:hypothetical protein